ncbi:PAS domain S-box protein [Fodinibius sp. AD559]|uniref:PAS domain S-box protein n=1 Tax=Fodinibius sp. AD559 TaxID=3424179 RepID=UPI00404690C4
MSKNNNQYISLSPLKITVIYLIVAALWIAFTDRLLESLVTDANALSTLQTYKGWFYVFLTSAGLFWLIKKHDQQLKTKELKLENLLRDIQSKKELKDVLFERIPVLITIYDPDLKTFEVNKEFEKVIGWSNEEVEEEDIDLLKACYPDLDDREEIVDFMNSPGVGWKEFHITTKSGEQLPISWTNVRLTDDTSVGIGIDMTDIKASQAKIRRSEKLLKKIFESLESSLIIVDPRSRTIVDCNSATREIFGYSEDELIGNSTQILHVNEQMYRKFDEMGAQPLEENGVFQTEFQMQKKDGTIFYSDHTVTMVYDEDGEVDKVVSVVRDISDRKKNELELKRRQERLLRSQKIGQIGDWEFNPKTEKISWSQTMFDIYERDPEMGPPSFDEIQNNYFGTDSQKHNESVKRAIEHGESYDIDLELHTDKGNQKYIRVIGIPTKIDEGENTKLRGIVQDITERKKSEKKLKQRNTFIETTLQNLPVGIAVNTIDGGKTTLMNDRFSEIYGWPKKTLKDVESFFEHVYQDPDYRAQIKKQVMQDMESGQPERMNWKGIQITTQEGDKKYVNNKAIPLYKQNLMISTVIDVTEQKKLEKELQKEKQRFKLVADTTSDVIWDYDIQNEEIWWSKGFEDHFGYDRSKLADDLSSWTNHIHPDDKVRTSESLEKAINGEDKFWQEKYRFNMADGSIAHIIDRGIIIRDKNGEAVRMVGTLNNITERVKAEQRLRESEEKYRHIFDNNPEPMWIYDPDTMEYVEVNQAAIEHYGYTEKEFLNMTLADIRPPEDIERLKNTIEKHRSEETYIGEWRHLKKDGTLMHVEVTASNIQYRDQTYRLALMHDITEQKRMQEKIIQSVIEGEDRERKRIAHELHDGLGQHLVAASMNLQSAKADIEKLSDKRQKQFETGISLLKNALSETRNIAHNLMPKAISDYGLIAALENLINDFNKSTEIDFHFNHNYDELKLKDQAEINIYRIFQELITNAVRHSECTRIEITLHLKNDSLKIMIKDNGIGTQLDEQDEKAGLGLRSIKTRVSNLNGSLDINSEPGEGMQTTITIPEVNNLKSNNTDHE